MNVNDLPKCQCGATTGLSVQGGHVQCPSCLWAEIKRLRAIVAADDAYFRLTEPSTACERQDREDAWDKCCEARKAADAAGG